MSPDNSTRPSNAYEGQSFGSARSATQALKDNVGDALDRGKSNISDSAQTAREGLAEDLSKMRADMASMQETLAKFISEASGQAAKTTRDVGEAVTTQVGAAASEIASSATEQVKTFASELEGMARKNPLGTLAGTLLVGIVIGMMSRGRS